MSLSLSPFPLRVERVSASSQQGAAGPCIVLIVGLAQPITGCPPRPIDDLYASRGMADATGEA